MLLQCQYYNDHDAVLCQVLSVSQHDVSDIADPKSVYQDGASRLPDPVTAQPSSSI